MLRLLDAFSIFPLKSLFASVVSGPPRWDVVEYLSAVFQWSVKLDSDVPVIYIYIYSLYIFRWICCSPTVLVFCKGTDCWLPPALDGNQCIDRSDLSSCHTVEDSFAHVYAKVISIHQMILTITSGWICSINFLNQRSLEEHFSFPVFSASNKTFKTDDHTNKVDSSNQRVYYLLTEMLGSTHAFFFLISRWPDH